MKEPKRPVTQRQQTRNHKKAPKTETYLQQKQWIKLV